MTLLLAVIYLTANEVSHRAFAQTYNGAQSAGDTIMSETFDYVECYSPAHGQGYCRYASATLVRSSGRIYWQTQYENYNHHFVLNDYGFLVAVGMW